MDPSPGAGAGPTGESPKAKLARALIENGMLAFDPSSKEPADVTQRARSNFSDAIERAGTWTLVQVLNSMIKPDAVPAWLRAELLSVLTLVPLRPDGVRATMEFIFTVHPSNIPTKTEEATPQKQGAMIAPEALAMAAQLLSSVPPGTADQTWIDALAPQLLALLDGKNGLELSRVASYVIAFGILGRRRLGAPGSPGWKAFVEPILFRIKPSLDPHWRVELQKRNDTVEVIDLSQDQVVVSADELHLALQRLSLLLTATPSPGLCRRLIDPIFLQLWAICSWPNPTKAAKEKYCGVASSMLRMYLKITSAPEKIKVMLHDMLYAGDVVDTHFAWKFQVSKDGSMDIVVPRGLESPRQAPDLDWPTVEWKASYLATTVVESCTDDDISAVFLQLFQKWLTSKAKSPISTIGIQLENQEEDESPIKGLLEMMVLQQLMEKATEKLISKADQLLDLVCQVLRAHEVEPQEDDVISVTLSILNQVISAPGFQKSDVKPEVLATIEKSLDSISRDHARESSQTAGNLLLLLRYRDELEEPMDMTRPTDKQVEDRSTYKLAISYITDPESPPPVRSEGLNLISGLIQSNSAALDLPAVLVLLSRLLADSEDFINLRVIKMFVQLADRHPKTACQEILDHYLDPKELATTDTRLRFGEALSQVVERLGKTFTGPVAAQVCEALLSVAGRRGHRVKTAKRQEREAKLQEKKNREADEAWGGEVLDMSEEVTEEERIKNEILSAIVEGWESKRGSEDVRMRTSALSILSTAAETNISGMGSSLVSATVDLCVHVLAFEPGMEKGILRRAAIVFILSFARALDGARQGGRTLGFGLTDESREDIVRTLRYIEATDNDGLVRQHATDVIESLENLRMGDILHQSRREAPEIERIVGLPPRLDIHGGGSGRPRPRIEEIE